MGSFEPITKSTSDQGGDAETEDQLKETEGQLKTARTTRASYAGDTLLAKVLRKGMRALPNIECHVLMHQQYFTFYQTQEARPNLQQQMSRGHKRASGEYMPEELHSQRMKSRLATRHHGDPFSFRLS